MTEENFLEFMILNMIGFIIFLGVIVYILFTGPLFGRGDKGKGYTNSY